MKDLKTILLSTGLLLQFIISLSTYADQIVDDEFDDNENNFEYYWYYFDDLAGVGLVDRPPTAKPSVVLVPFTEHMREFEGNTPVMFKIKEYKFKTDTAGTNNFATMPFIFGDEFKTKAGLKVLPYVGIGTMLAPDGKSIDLTGASKIRFKLKSRVNNLSVRFKIQTFEIDSISGGTAVELEAEDNDPFGYYGINKMVNPGTFQDFEVNIDTNGGDLLPPGWARAALPFNLKRVTKLVWEVNKDDNATVTGDTLDIDAIEIIGYTYNSPHFQKKTVPLTPLPTSGLFSNFSGTVPQRNALKKYWYAFTDAANGGTSTIPTGATLDTETNLFTLNWAAQTGSSGSDTGLQLIFKIGDPVMLGETEVSGFVGFGCNIYDSAFSKYWDGKAAGVKSIYFHYITDGDIPYLTLEISDVNDVADKDNPTRKDGRGPGVVWYKNFPNTANRWVAVELPLDSLVINRHWKGDKDTPLDLTKLAKLQWKVQGAKGCTGSVAIDNVYFPGIQEYSEIIISASEKLRIVKRSNFNAIIRNGKIHVTIPNGLEKGSVRLFNSNGIQIATKKLCKTNAFSTGNIPSGIYFVKINGLNSNRETIFMQSSITIVK